MLQVLHATNATFYKFCMLQLLHATNATPTCNMSHALHAHNQSCPSVVSLHVLVVIALLWIQCHLCINYSRDFIPQVRTIDAKHQVSCTTSNTFYVRSDTFYLRAQTVSENIWVSHLFLIFCTLPAFCAIRPPDHLFLIFCRSAIRSAIVVLSSPPVVGAKYVPISQAETSDAENS